MIRIGFKDERKQAEIAAYCATHGIRKIFVLSPRKFMFPLIVDSIPVEWIEWEDIIRYTFFYRLLQEIGPDSLVVVNECLRTQNRNDLTYNCMRHFLAQAGHQIICNYLPLIDAIDDFMILFDFDTKSRWKREKFSARLLAECDIASHLPEFSLHKITVCIDEKTEALYKKTKRDMIDNIGLRDPHTIPRTLHLVAGKCKRAASGPGTNYIGRNNRFGMDRMSVYRDEAFPRDCTVFEFCHNFIDFSGFLALSGQSRTLALVSGLKVDQWYFERYQAWLERIAHANAAIR